MRQWESNSLRQDFLIFRSSLNCFLSCSTSKRKNWPLKGKVDPSTTYLLLSKSKELTKMEGTWCTLSKSSPSFRRTLLRNSPLKSTSRNSWRVVTHFKPSGIDFKLHQYSNVKVFIHGMAPSFISHSCNSDTHKNWIFW